MTLESLNLMSVAPELALFALVVLVMLIEIVTRSQAKSLVHMVSVAGLLTLSLWLLQEAAFVVSSVGMNGMVVVDLMGHLLKSGASLTTAVALIYCRRSLEHEGMGFGEFHLFALFSLLGGFVMISANHLLVVYLGIELLTLSLYAAVALRRDSAISTEAAMKYFVLGALASGFLLYGMSMLYGATGSLEIPIIQDKLSMGRADRLVVVFGAVFLVAGLAFKLGVVPFHMWVPDVYQGAPTATTLLIGAAPKFAAFAVLIRLLVSGLIGVAIDWQQMLLVLCVLSLVVGNLVAIMQTNVKRILAYSTIAHMGFMLLAISSGVLGEQVDGAVNAYAASMFYIVTYALTALGSFGVILLASEKGIPFETLDDFKGLAKTRPELSWIMLILVFSLAGIPPMVGFSAKLAVLESAVSAGYLELAVFAVMASLVGAFFYLRIVKTMFFDEPLSPPPSTPLCGIQRSVLSANALAVLLLGILPGPLMAWCVAAIRLSLSS